MKRDNVVPDKSMDLAVRIVRLYQYLCDQKKSMYCPDKF